MKKSIVFGMLLLANTVQAQIFTEASGDETMFITSGTVFHANGITLTPSADYTLSNVSLSLNTTVANSTLNTYVSRVYKFSATTPAFSGTVRIDYLDAELNGLSESTLQVNVHNGSSWQNITSATNDASSNYVLSSSLSSVALNELTLAISAHPLPLQWHSFTAKKQNKNVVLDWATVQEQNTMDFMVQHSLSGTNWNNINNQPAAGNSNTIKNYSYLHTNPIKGNNYYRILQRDLSGKNSYSEVRKVKMENKFNDFELINNPVTNGTAIIQVYSPALFSVYSYDGKLLLQKQFAIGTQSIDMSDFAKGVYLLKVADQTAKIVVQ